MHLAYFDENKYSKENPYFFIGGYLVPDKKVLDLDNALMEIQSNFFGKADLTVNTEFHGKDMFHGKGNCKGRKLKDRVGLFEELVNLLSSLSFAFG